MRICRIQLAKPGSEGDGGKDAAARSQRLNGVHRVLKDHNGHGEAIISRHELLLITEEISKKRAGKNNRPEFGQTTRNTPESCLRRASQVAEQNWAAVDPIFRKTTSVDTSQPPGASVNYP